MTVSTIFYERTRDKNIGVGSTGPIRKIRSQQMETNNHNLQKKTFPFGGILLVIAGLFLLLNQLVAFDLNGGVFFGTLGLFFILWGATNRNAGLLIPGGIVTGLSIGIFLVEDTQLIPEQYQGGVFVIALAAGFGLITLLTRIFVEKAHWWALIVAGLLALVGSGIIIVEMPDAGMLQQVVEAAFTASQYLWPLVLVGLGLWIIFKKRDAQA
jgi:hypothetical protein